MRFTQEGCERKQPIATPIHIHDTGTGESWGLAKSVLLDPRNPNGLMPRILSRPKDFVIRCGCKETDCAVLYARKRYGRNEICNHPSLEWNHDPSCPYWAESPPAAPTESLTRRDRASSLGRLFKVLELSMRQDADEEIDKGLPPVPARRGRHTPGPSSLAAAVLALLDFAGLNRYSPTESSASWSDNGKTLADAIDALSCDQSETTPPPRVVANGMLLRLFDLPLVHSRQATRAKPQLVLGSIVNPRKEGNYVLVNIEGFIHDIRMSKADWRYAIKRAPSRHTLAALKTLGKSDRAARVLGLFELTRDEFDDVVAHRVGLCATSAELVPVESSHELAMANCLVAHGRTFIKDIYVPAGHLFRYDFRLLDTGREFVIEVKGMDTPKYNEGKHAMEEHLASNCAGHHLIWSAVLGHPLPTLPPKEIQISEEFRTW